MAGSKQSLSHITRDIVDGGLQTHRRFRVGYDADDGMITGEKTVGIRMALF
ncbi:MAG: hypothetical protein HZB28_00625 [Methylocystis sp.]|nr:hypothetical protein [Methylocystis sp.]